jgi:hypothetical protein
MALSIAARASVARPALASRRSARRASALVVRAEGEKESAPSVAPVEPAVAPAAPVEPVSFFGMCCGVGCA